MLVTTWFILIIAVYHIVGLMLSNRAVAKLNKGRGVFQTKAFVKPHAIVLGYISWFILALCAGVIFGGLFR